MANESKPAIARLVEANDGPTALARKLKGTPPYQQIQVWLSRGWGAPKHFPRLEPFMPDGMTMHDLFADMPAPAVSELAEAKAA